MSPTSYQTAPSRVILHMYYATVKIKNQVIRTSSTDVISSLSKKKIFSRNFMERTMGLTTGQAYWYIKRLLKTGMIRKLTATEYVGNKGKQQALYKYVSK